jgi:hypothetical protein
MARPPYPDKIDGSAPVTSDAPQSPRSRSATRQQRHRDKLARAGLTQCSLWLPRSVHADLHELVAALAANPDCEIPLLLRAPGGRLVSIKSLRSKQ